MRPISYSKLFKLLGKHDKGFRIHKDRGKGSHRMLVHIGIDGKRRQFPIPFHGTNSDIPRIVLQGIIKRFDLPRDIFR